MKIGEKMKQITKERKEAYVEVVEILNNMDSKYVEKIPSQLIEFFINNSSKEYKFKLDKTIPFEEQHLKENTINILAMLNLNYWCESQEHRKYLLQKYYDNEMAYQNKIMERYSTEKLFKKRSKSIVVPNKQEENIFPEYYEEPKWYERLYEIVSESISKLIRRLFY